MKKNKLLAYLIVILVVLVADIGIVASALAPGEARIGETYYTTLEEAVAAAKAGDIVEITSDVQLTKTLTVANGITITTDGVADRTIRGTPSSGNYYINVTTTASTLSGASEDSRLVIDGGGGIHDRALVCLQAADSRMQYVTLKNNTSTYSGGGGLYTNKTGITVEDCIIQNNRCSGTTGGGGVYLTGGAAADMINCTIIGNSATVAAGGGGFVAKNSNPAGDGGILNLERCTVTNNSAATTGGAFQVNGSCMPKGCTISGNKSAGIKGSSSLLDTLPAFDGTLLGTMDGSDGLQEAVYQITASGGDTYVTYAEKLTGAGYSPAYSQTIDSNTYGTFSNSVNTVTLLNTPGLGGGTLRILIEPNGTLPDLDSAVGKQIVTPTVTMLGVGDSASQNGMSFIYQLSDGRFLVVDGGYLDDADQIYSTMKALAGKDDVTVAAWLLTHAHNDHVEAFVAFWSRDYSTHVTLEKVIYNFPGSSTFKENIIGGAQSLTWYTNTTNIINDFPVSTERIKAHPGQVFTLGDATVTMLYTAELMAPDELWNFNDTSLIFTVQLGNMKFMHLGDCASAAGSVLTSAYGGALSSDALQVAHHGHFNNIVSQSLYESIDASYAFWPSTQERYDWDENRNAPANIWLFEQQSSGALEMWCAGDSIQIFKIKDGVLTLFDPSEPDPGGNDNKGGNNDTPAPIGSFSGGNAYTKSAAKGLICTVQKDLSLLNEAKIGDHTLVKNMDYIAEGDPVKITLVPFYLDSLAAGTHTLTLTFKDGVSVSVRFTVAAGENLPFIDVAESAWYFRAVSHVYTGGLMNGTAADKFSPDDTLTRGMVVTILHRMSGSPKATAAYAFDDVENGAWYADAVAWAAENVVVRGYGDSRFGPEDPVTKEQLATLLYRLQHQTRHHVLEGFTADKTFTDQDTVSIWAADAVNAILRQGLYNDIPGARLAPQESANRAEIASMLYRYLAAAV